MTSFTEVTGVLDKTQFPNALLSDGSRQLTGHLSVATGITVDGVDISSFRSEYQAHLGNPLSHDYVRNILDDINQPVLRNDITNDIRIYGSGGISVTVTEAGLRISGSTGGIGGGTGFGIKDGMGTGATPDGTGYINLMGNTGIGVVAGGNSVAISFIPGSISHQDLGGRGKHDHHTAFVGLTVGATSVVPNASDRILFQGGTNVSISTSASTVTIGLSSTPVFTGLTVNGNFAITGTVDGVDVSVLNTDFDTLLSNFDAHALATIAHGATGAVVGTTNTQTLTNKTLTLPSINNFTNAQHTHQGATSGGKLDHGAALNGLGDDDHTQYVHNTSARTITAIHTFSPSSATAPFILGANGQGQTVVGLRADQLNKSVTAGNGLTGGGTLTGNISLAVGQGTGITVAATTVGVNTAHAFAWTADHAWSNNKISFGSSTRQMIDLYSTNYGIGVQASTAYIRTASRFSVHLSGVHSNTDNDPGSGGTNLFTLTTSIITYKGNTIWHAANDGAGSGLDSDLWDGNQFASFLNQAVRTTDSPTFAALTVNGLITATATSENVRLRYDANNYASFTVGTANLTLGVRGASSVIGSLTLDVENVYPFSALGTNLGSTTQKYLTLHAAELWVDTLVAQDKIATIGGRILVGPTTTLTRDLLSASTLIYVKHNHFANGDFVYLEGAGKIEFIKINSAVTNMADGDYRYTVLRNQDASGANGWYSGDAVFNTGTTNEGWIDLYAISSMSGTSHTGPTIVGNVRTGATWNLWEPRWAVGNLNGIYGYGAATYGAAFGAPTATNVTIDNVNGFRVRKSGSTVISSWNTTGDMTLGDTATEHIIITPTNLLIKDNASTYLTLSSSGIALGILSSTHVNLTPTALQFKDGNNVYTSLTGGALSLGLVSTGDYLTIDGTNGVRIYNNATVSAHWKANGDLVIGEVANSRSRIEITSGAINIINRSAGSVDTTAISLSNSGSASFTGKVTATSGAIGGWSLAATSLSATNITLTSGAANAANILAGTGATAGGINSANASGDIVFWAGNTHANRSSAGFRVLANGTLYATSANITGNITGSTISGTSIVSGSATLDTDGLKILVSTSDIWNLQNGLKFMSGTSVLGYLWSYKYTTEYAIQLLSQCPSGEVANTSIMSSASFGSALIKAETNDSADQSTVHATVSAPGQTGSLLMTGSAGGTTLAISVGAATINSSLTLNGYLRGNQAGNSLRIDTGTGYIDVGPKNTSFAHIETDRPVFYFNKRISVDENIVTSYDGDFLLQRATATKLTLTSTGATVTGLMTATTGAFTQATGTAPFTVASTTVVTNLNADLWDGQHLATYLNQAVLTTSSPRFGALGIDVNPGAFKLNVTGNSQFTGDQTVTGIMNVTGTLIIPDGGTVTTPSIYFEGDANTGFYRWASDSWSLVAGGVSLISMTSTSIDLKEELGDWVTLTLTTNWTNYGGAFGGAQYKRVGDLVFVRGLVTCANWAGTTSIATLPAGFRPLTQQMVLCAGNASGSAIRLDIETTGVIRYLGGGAGNGWISLNNIILSIK